MFNKLLVSLLFVFLNCGTASAITEWLEELIDPGFPTPKIYESWKGNEPNGGPDAPQVVKESDLIPDDWWIAMGNSSYIPPTATPEEIYRIVMTEIKNLE